MNPPHPQLDGADVLYYCDVRDERLRPKGNHAVLCVEDGSSITPRYAAICRYEGSNHVYLFYCDEEWRVISDWDHPSVEDAIESLEYWYGGASSLMIERA